MSEPPSSSSDPLPLDHRLAGLGLGAFVLKERVGVGGMSEVWRATHVESGVEVAVKLIGSSARSPGDREGTAPRRDRGLSRAAADAMRQEISLLSRLDHPGILRVLSFGVVELPEAHASGGELVAGSPYLVTPWARAGSLDRAPPPEDWPALRAILRALLLALALAHARGVVHRDLKPANVLLIGEGPTQRPVLSDFGIAFALLRAQRGIASEGDQQGTPAYMAPEQVLGPPMEQGPAIDLYALGCLAFRLASGKPPFVGPTDEVLRAHALLPPPKLRATFAVPEGFAEWVSVLLAKEPQQRFPSAASARHALEALDTGSEWVAPRNTSAPPPMPRTSPDAVTAPQAHLVAARRSMLPEPLQIRASLFPPAPPPLTWRELDELALPQRTRRSSAPNVRRDSGPPRPSRPDFELEDAGLGLFGVRRLDLIGRERERDVLYGQLMAVHGEGMCRAVVLRGPFGMGTTRLGEWLLEIASELDVGQPLHVEAGQARSPGDAVVELLVQLFGTEGMSPEQQAARTRAWAKDAALSVPEAEDLLAVIERRSERFAYPSERDAAVRRALSRASLRVPLVIFLDDAVVDPEVMALVASSLESDEPLSVLFVLSVSSELLEHGASFAFTRGPSLRRVLDLPRVTELTLGPLAPDEQGELVQELLGLAPELAREVVERSEGRPLFAFQLVGDWVARDLLQPGLFGFVMREGEGVEVPDGIHQLLRRRLDDARDAIAARASVQGADEALIGLELAALLSPAPSIREWYAVLDAAQISAAQALPELAARGLVRPRRDRIEIAHRMLRETLYRRAREGGRYASHHRVIASVLRERDVDPSRLAYHHLEAGDRALALDPLCASAERRCARSDWTGALEALRQHVDALDALGATDDDPRRIRGRLLRAEVLGHGVLLDEANLALSEAELGLRAMDAQAPERAALEARWRWLCGVFAQARGARALLRIARDPHRARAHAGRERSRARGEGPLRHRRGEQAARGSERGARGLRRGAHRGGREPPARAAGAHGDLRSRVPPRQPRSGPGAGAASARAARSAGRASRRGDHQERAGRHRAQARASGRGRGALPRGERAARRARLGRRGVRAHEPRAGLDRAGRSRRGQERAGRGRARLHLTGTRRLRGLRRGDAPARPCRRRGCSRDRAGARRAGPAAGGLLRSRSVVVPRARAGPRRGATERAHHPPRRGGPISAFASARSDVDVGRGRGPDRGRSVSGSVSVSASAH